MLENRKWQWHKGPTPWDQLGLGTNLALGGQLSNDDGELQKIVTDFKPISLLLGFHPQSAPYLGKTFLC